MQKNVTRISVIVRQTKPRRLLPSFLQTAGFNTFFRVDIVFSFLIFISFLSLLVTKDIQKYTVKHSTILLFFLARYFF